MPDFSIFFDVSQLAAFSAAAIFFILFFGTFVSEDLACITAGTLIGQGHISFTLGLSSCFAGIFVGDILLFLIGRVFGRRVARHPLFSRFVSDKALEKAGHWLARRGPETVFLSRFIIGLRLPTYLAAGFLKTNLVKFSFYFLIASAVWTPILIASTAYAQQFIFKQNWLLGVVLLFIILRVTFHFSSWENRRLFRGKLVRLRNWEFWPLYIFYAPVVVYILFLAAKLRSLTVFTASNPGIFGSGFVGESKDLIYQGLASSTTVNGHLLKHSLIPADLALEQKIVEIDSFIETHGLDFPVVLKPNSGERGKGVFIARNRSQLHSYLDNSRGSIIIQEYFEGVEAGVFYFRYPGSQEGNIFSITEKRFPYVIGDGISDLRYLILQDKRAVALARAYFRHNHDRLDFVPASGDKVQIINIGTHSMGAIFVDGEWLKSKELLEKLDEIARGFNGFYFGRFDIRAESFEALRNGEGFKIIELNGVSSESTNIYDPKFSLWAAYRILFRQWRIAFEIGSENVNRGVRPLAFRDLYKMILARKKFS